MYVVKPVFTEQASNYWSAYIHCFNIYGSRKSVQFTISRNM